MVYILVAAAVALGLVALAPVSLAEPGPVYSTCGEASAAGVSDIPQTDPAYWEDGDRDGDGVACESTNY